MSKIKNGLLLVHLSNQQNIYPILQRAGELVEKKLYIDLLQNVSSTNSVNTNNAKKNDYFRLLSSVYSRPRTVCGEIDLQVLLPECSANMSGRKRKLSGPLDMCVVENLDEGMTTENIESIIKERYNLDGLTIKILGDCGVKGKIDLDAPQYNFNFSKGYSGVVIGGTFDQVHDGHKLLIQTALLLADDKITVGVADGPLLEKKLLKELIEPVVVRINKVVNLIEESKPGIKHKVVSITDPCGPSGNDDDLQLLLVSKETIQGGPIVNQKRKDNGLSTLDVMNIELVGASPTDLAESLNSEGKLSSSAARVRELGKLLRQPNKPRKEGHCYVVGVTGGIASGKSSVVKKLEKLGAYTVDCDLLGHKAYVPGQPAYNRIIQEFGDGILNGDGSIDRKKLGPIVFSEKSKLELLNGIVWPEIHRMKQEIIDEVSKEGKHDIVVFEGAVLFEAGWHQEANEVWCCVIPKGEAVKRIVERNALTEEAALKRINSQMSNEDRVNKSHVILSTYWEREFTLQQCEKAWKLLCQRLNLPTKTLSSL